MRPPAERSGLRSDASSFRPDFRCRPGRNQRSGGFGRCVRKPDRPCQGIGPQRIGAATDCRPDGAHRSLGTSVDGGGRGSWTRRPDRRPRSARPQPALDGSQPTICCLFLGTDRPTCRARGRCGARGGRRELFRRRSTAGTTAFLTFSTGVGAAAVVDGVVLSSRIAGLQIGFLRSLGPDRPMADQLASGQKIQALSKLLGRSIDYRGALALANSGREFAPAAREALDDIFAAAVSIAILMRRYLQRRCPGSRRRAHVRDGGLPRRGD